jgi:RHS repeat-associated protein
MGQIVAKFSKKCLDYYPFGLKHSGYNSDQLMYIKQGTTTKIVPVPPLFKTSYDVKFQGQKREEELGLNWDSFKYRNYDFAIGRFHSVDPLSEQYAYNSTYAIQENKMGMGRELEGLELVPFEFMFENTGVTPTIEALTKIGEVSTQEAEVSTAATESHHVIPRALKNTELVEQARGDGFKFEGQENRIGLEKFSRATGEGQHANHPNYNNAVKNLLRQGPANGETPVEFIRNLVSELKSEIKSNPLTKINDLLKTNTVVIDNTKTRKPEIPIFVKLPTSREAPIPRLSPSPVPREAPRTVPKPVPRTPQQN